MMLLVVALLGYVSASRLRRSSNATAVAAPEAKQDKYTPPCQCHPNDRAWTTTTRTVPKCIFIDLGAADGNTFQTFLSDGFGPVANCPSGQWEAWLVEANPHFDAPLKALQAKYPGQVHALPSTAAYSCAGKTSFFIDTDPTHNHWGSSMSDITPDAIKSGKTKVTVPTVNVMQLINENTIPGDWVMLKVDIEGAEFDVIPCLAQYPKAGLIDRMYLEEHTWFDHGHGNGKQEMEAAKAQLREMHVDMPSYWTKNTLF